MTNTFTSNIIDTLRNNTDETSKVILKIYDSVNERLFKEQKVTPNSLFIVYISLLNSSNATKTTKDGIVFLVCTVLEHISTGYIEQNFSFLLPEFINSIKNNSENITNSSIISNTILTSFPFLFVQGNQKGAFMKFITNTIISGKSNDSLAAWDLVSDILLSAEIIILNSSLSFNIMNQFISNFCESFSSLILCCLRSERIHNNLSSLISRFVHCFNTRMIPWFHSVIEWIVEKRNAEDKKSNILDQIMIQIIQNIEPQDLLPLISSLNSSIRIREWLLPLLLKYSPKSLNLDIFMTWFIPWIDSYLKDSTNNSEESSIHYVFTWGFLPKLIKNSNDLEKTFPILKYMIKSSLLDIRVASITCNSLCVLIENNHDKVRSNPLNDILKSLIQQLCTCFINASQDHKSYFFNTLIYIASILNESECISYYNIEYNAMSLNENDFHIELLSIFAIYTPTKYEAFLTFMNERLFSSIDRLIRKKIFRSLDLFFSKISERSNISNSNLIQFTSPLVQFCINSPDQGKNFYRFLKSIFSYLSIACFDLAIKLFPELILGCRLTMNPIIRQLCIDTCLKFAHNFIKDNPDTQLERLFELFASGLTNHSTSMISSSITCISLLITEFKDNISHALYTKLLSLVDSIAVSLKGKECLEPFIDLIKSLMFIKHLGKPHLFKFIILLIKITQDNGTFTFKLKQRHIIEKCIKLYGEEEIEQIFLQSITEHSKLFNYIRKQLRYKKTKEYKETMNTKDNDSELLNLVQKFAHSNTSDPIDLMSNNYPRSFVGQNQEKFEFDDTGKLVIDKETSIKYSTTKVKNESDNDSDSWQDIAATKQATSKSIINLPFKYSGNAFKSKKGKGDILKSNSVEPFAYIPLRKKLLKQNRYVLLLLNIA